MEIYYHVIPIYHELILIEAYYQCLETYWLCIAKPTSIELVGRLELLISSIMSSICPVSLILVGKLLAISYNTFSTNMGKDSIAVLQPLVMIRDGLSFLTASHMFCHLPAILTETSKIYLKAFL